MKINHVCIQTSEFTKQHINEVGVFFSEHDQQ
jgi:hypothetical protein